MSTQSFVNEFSVHSRSLGCETGSSLLANDLANLSRGFASFILGTEKVPQRNCVTKILPNVRVNFLVRFASEPLFYWVVTGNPPPNCSENSLVLFVRFFGFVGLFWLPIINLEISQFWETDFHPVPVLGGIVLFLMRVLNCSPVLDKVVAPIGPGILSSTGAGVWRKASVAFPNSSSVLDKFLSAKS